MDECGAGWIHETAWGILWCSQGSKCSGFPWYKTYLLIRENILKEHRSMSSLNRTETRWNPGKEEWGGGRLQQLCLHLPPYYASRTTKKEPLWDSPKISSWFRIDRKRFGLYIMEWHHLILIIICCSPIPAAHCLLCSHVSVVIPKHPISPGFCLLSFTHMHISCHHAFRCCIALLNEGCIVQNRTQLTRFQFCSCSWISDLAPKTYILNRVKFSQWSLIR